uniref:Uncharacterized protein n=1 Tax=Anguilla anguilla TaxID=7936 RepID=A0A0E9U4K5_ANGAN
MSLSKAHLDRLFPKLTLKHIDVQYLFLVEVLTTFQC